MNLQNMDRRWIFLLIALLTYGGLLLTVDMPQNPSPSSVAYFNQLEQLPPGSVVVVSADYGPSTRPELEPMHRLTIYQLLKHKCRVINIAMTETGTNQTAPAMSWALERLRQEGIDSKADVDYITLGFKAGGEPVMSQFGSSIRTTYRTDTQGRPIWDNLNIPVLAGVATVKDIRMLITIAAGSPGTREWLSQLQKRYHVNVMSGVTAVMAPELYTFFHSGQLLGFLGGLVGAADYEKLLGMTENVTDGGLSILVPNFANRAMFAQSLIHYTIVLLIIIANIDFLLGKRKEARRR